MALPFLSVPPFPDVPNVPGVPTVLRSTLSAANRITGTLQGVQSGLDGAFTGSLSGFLVQTSGVSTPIAGTLRGVLDEARNLSATLYGAVGGSVLGSLSGSVDVLTGVISGAVTGVVDQITGLVNDVFGSPAGTLPPPAVPFVWGIFTSDGAPVITGDTVVSFENVKDYRISTFPVEGGGFESYNKVETPFDVRMTFTKGGSIAERAAFLAQVEAVTASLDLFSAATPERTYLDVNVTHYDYRRTNDRGATLLVVELGLEQVRTTVTATFINTQAPNGADAVNVGPVQPVEPTPAQAASFDLALEGAPA